MRSWSQRRAEKIKAAEKVGAQEAVAKRKKARKVAAVTALAVALGGAAGTIPGKMQQAEIDRIVGSEVSKNAEHKAFGVTQRMSGILAYGAPKEAEKLEHLLQKARGDLSVICAQYRVDPNVFAEFSVEKGTFTVQCAKGTVIYKPREGIVWSKFSDNTHFAFEKQFVESVEDFGKQLTKQFNAAGKIATAEIERREENSNRTVIAGSLVGSLLFGLGAFFGMRRKKK